MQNYCFLFRNLSSSLFNDEKKFETFKKSIIKDIKFKSGYDPKKFQFHTQENSLYLLIELPKEKESLVSVILNNLKDAKQIHLQPVESC